MPELLYQDETYKIIGVCFDIHNQLGPGFSEIVYKDALEYEFRTQNIYFEREVEYSVFYKTVVLPHKFYADFVVFEHIILEVKGIQKLAREHISQTINYLKVSGNDVGLLVNFGEPKLTYKRLVL
ncbi:MAG: GxxExxY protein [Bacteroidales bacterium]|nr:GxxExxY protein [Bacteroidales bacterium]